MVQRLIVEPGQVTADQIMLSPEQQHYLHRVLRLVPGDRFLVLDGQGHQWEAQLTPTPGLAIATALPIREPSTLAITLAIALPKGNGFDEVVRQTTELGVTILQPIITERTLAHPSPNKLERWRRIAAEATEQSERLRLPQLYLPLGWTQYLAQLPEPSQRWICVARKTAPPLLAVAQSCDLDQPIVIATGPEGGWTEAEIAAAEAAGFQLVSLGPQILRAVTAPLAALAIARTATSQP